MKNKILKTIFSLGIILVSMESMAVYEINSRKVLHCTISNTGLTRISIENDIIKDMFAFPASVSTSLNLHPSGNVFVAPAGVNDPIFLTVISGSGVTQDLKLTFAKRSPRPLLLKIKEQKVASKKDIERWMRVGLIGEAPRHFKEESHIPNKITTSQSVANEYKRFSNGVYSISLWSVKSKVNKPVLLSADFYIESNEAGKLSKSELEPYGTTKLVIVSKNKIS